MAVRAMFKTFSLMSVARISMVQPFSGGWRPRKQQRQGIRFVPCRAGGAPDAQLFVWAFVFMISGMSPSCETIELGFCHGKIGFIRGDDRIELADFAVPVGIEAQKVEIAFKGLTAAGLQPRKQATFKADTSCCLESECRSSS